MATQVDISQPSALSSSSVEQQAVRVKHQRKRHTKSHYGCTNCRKRRTKCQENRPACDNCINQKLDCVYPPGSSRRAAIRTLVPSLRNAIQLHSTPIVFNVTDSHLFYHFRTTAYPHIPLGNGDVWTTRITSLVHTYEFLSHAALGLAAAHLAHVSTSNLWSSSLAHRVQAVRGLNEALSHPPTRGEDADAILATCYALAVQTTYIGESVAEFLTMLRGCHLVISKKWHLLLGSHFHRIENYCQLHQSSEKLRVLPVYDPAVCVPAIESMKLIQPLCVRPTEVKVCDMLLGIVSALNESTREACQRYSVLCSTLPALPDDEFRAMLDPNNAVAQVLLVHYAAILVLLYPIKAMEWTGRDLGRPNRRTLFRTEFLFKHIPPSMEQYAAWPLRVLSGAPGE